MLPQCTIVDCKRPSVARGWCQTHYMRWRRQGDPEIRGRFRKAPIERFVAKVRFTDCCWLWMGARGAQMNYGWFAIDYRPNAKSTYAHRWAYEFFKAPIPADREIDHLCNTPRCVNPDHLEAVPHSVNMERQRRRKA